jgi:hypothetical protein
MNTSNPAYPIYTIYWNAPATFPNFICFTKKLHLPMITILILVLMSCAGQVADRLEEERIKPYEKNQKYWQYKGEPVMLLGANKTDSPFLLPDQEAYYDELASLGGNYTRYNVKQRLVQDLMPLLPHKKLPDGTYDLNQWDEGYWDRFEQGLILTRDRDIIVQLELWDRFDVGCETHYMSSSWKPSNNINYTETQSGMPDEWGGCDRVVHKHPFYSSIPSLDNNQLILNLQHDFADKVLSISLKYDHVLYVITNETTLDPGWSDYWARYIRDKAKAMKKNVEVSEMPWTIADNFPFDWQQPELGDPDKWIDHVIDHTGLYSFCAFQFQPILKSRQDHYDRIAEVYDRVMQSSVGPRPINAVKIFAREKIIVGESEPNAQTRFWRPLLAGWAAVSLHRAHPGTGYLGFGEAGKKTIFLLPVNFAMPLLHGNVLHDRICCKTGNPMKLIFWQILVKHTVFIFQLPALLTWTCMGISVRLLPFGG